MPLRSRWRERGERSVVVLVMLKRMYWQRIRLGVNRKSTNPPVTSVVVDPDTGTCGGV